MSKAKVKGTTHRHVSVYMPIAMLCEIERLAEDEFMLRSSWLQRAMMAEIQRHRKARSEAPFILEKRAESQRGAHWKRTKLITE